LVKLYTAHGTMYVDTAELASKKLRLRIYTARGNKLSDVSSSQKIRKQASYGVHRENLFASQELADAASDAVWRELYGENALTTKQLREQEIIPAPSCM